MGLKEDMARMHLYAIETRIKEHLSNNGLRCSLLDLVDQDSSSKHPFYYLKLNFSRDGVRTKIYIYSGGKNGARSIELKISTRRSDKRFRTAESYTTFSGKDKHPPCGYPPRDCGELASYIKEIIDLSNSYKPEEIVEIKPRQFHEEFLIEDGWTTHHSNLQQAICKGMCKIEGDIVRTDNIAVANPNMGELAFWIEGRIRYRNELIDIAYFENGTFLFFAGHFNLTVVSEKYNCKFLTVSDKRIILAAIKNESTYLK